MSNVKLLQLANEKTTTTATMLDSEKQQQQKRSSASSPATAECQKFFALSKRVPRDVKRFCGICRQHGLMLQTRGHVCTLKDCNCQKCSLVRSRRQVMSQQIRLRRAQDKRFLRTNQPSEADLIPLTSTTATMTIEAPEDITTFLPSTELLSEATVVNSSPSSSSFAQDQQQHLLMMQSFSDSVKNMCYFCQKCKNHSILVWKKHHKRQCPYVECACEKCDLIETRRQLDQHIKKRRLAAAAASATERSKNAITSAKKRSSEAAPLSVLPKRIATFAGVEWGSDCGQKTPPPTEYVAMRGSLSSRSSVTPTSIAEITATPSNIDCGFRASTAVTTITSRASTTCSSSATPPPLLPVVNAFDYSASQMLLQQLSSRSQPPPPPLFVNALLENLALICPPSITGSVIARDNCNVSSYFVNCSGIVADDDGDQSTTGTTTTSRRTSDASCAECTAVDRQQNGMNNNNHMTLEGGGIVECNNNVGPFNKEITSYLNNNNCYKKYMSDDNISTTTVFNNHQADAVFTINAAAQPSNAVFFPPAVVQPKDVNSAIVAEQTLLNAALLREWLLLRSSSGVYDSSYEPTKDMNTAKAMPMEAHVAAMQSTTNSSVLFAPISHTAMTTTTNGSAYDPLLEHLLRNPILNFSNNSSGSYGSVDVKQQQQQLLFALSTSVTQKEV